MNLKTIREALDIVIAEASRKCPFREADYNETFPVEMSLTVKELRQIYDAREQLPKNALPVQEETVAQANKPPAHSRSYFKVDDWVKLEALNADAGVKLRRFGKWWRVGGKRNKETEVLLYSMAGQPRECHARVQEVLTVGVIGDWNFNIIDRREFPSETKKIPKE